MYVTYFYYYTYEEIIYHAARLIQINSSNKLIFLSPSNWLNDLSFSTSTGTNVK